MPASAILRNIPLAVLTNSNITPVFWSTRWWSTTRISGASTSPGVKRCGIIAWREITFATTRNLRWSWHEITGIVFAPDKVCRATCKTARWCPAFSTRMNGGWIWWLSSVNGNTNTAGQYVLDEMLREIRHQLAQSQQLRPEQAAESED